MDKPIQCKEVFTINFDLVVPKQGAIFSQTLSQHELFKVVKRQLKAAFDTDICHTRNYGIARKVVNEYTKKVDAERAELEEILKENRRARVQIPMWRAIAFSMVERAKKVKCPFGGNHSVADCNCDPHQLGDAIGTMQEEWDKILDKVKEAENA